MNVDAIQKKSYSQENKMWSVMRKHYFQLKRNITTALKVVSLCHFLLIFTLIFSFKGAGNNLLKMAGSQVSDARN